MEKRQSACPLDCPDLCGLSVTVDDAGRVQEVTGDTRGPITNGFVCGKVRKFADHMYCDERIATPLIRTGPKGSGAWQPASWDAALDLIEARMRASIERHGPTAVLPYHYGGSNGWITEGGLPTRFFRRLGASNLARTFCAAATTVATRGLYGAMPGVALEDFVHAKLIVLWGVNPSATSIHLVPIIERAREAGAKLVVIDPRRTPLARRADLHLPVKPGADLPVALAIVSELLRRGEGRAWLAQHATGVDELAQRAAAWSIEAAAAEAQIDPVVLAQFIELYAQASPAVIRCGWGVERNRNGGSAVAAVLAIPAVGAKFGVRGGGFTLSNGDASWGAGAELGVGTPPTAARSINMSSISTALRDLRDPPIECMFVYNCNPVATAPDQALLVEQLQREDLFVVVHEQVMTDTAALADVVLPATTFLEHREVRRGYGTMRMFDSPAVAAPFGESRTNTELFGELLRRFGLEREGDAMTDEELAARMVPREQADQIARDGIALPISGTTPISFVDVYPGTPDQKVHLFPPMLEEHATHGLYVYAPDPGSEEFPLALISPALATQISSYFGQLRTAPGELELSRTDADARGIANGDRVRAWNHHGEVHCIARINKDVRDGVCVLPKGLWRKHTENGLTSNALIPPAFADLGGQAAFNDARVQVAKL